MHLLWAPSVQKHKDGGCATRIEINLGSLREHGWPSITSGGPGTDEKTLSKAWRPCLCANLTSRREDTLPLCKYDRSLVANPPRRWSDRERLRPGHRGCGQAPEAGQARRLVDAPQRTLSRPQKNLPGPGGFLPCHCGVVPGHSGFYSYRRFLLGCRGCVRASGACCQVMEACYYQGRRKPRTVENN